MRLPSIIMISSMILCFNSYYILIDILPKLSLFQRTL
nr:MAG TPA: hypothetical protein [Caudoviricetes sp.]